MSERILEVKNLAVSYHTYAGQVQSVRGISFELEEGKTLAIVGESGCGKSVTAKSLMGLIEKPGVIHEGSEIIFKSQNVMDFDAKGWSDFRGGDCSMIFQDALVSLNPTRMIGKQIIQNLKNHSKDMSKEDMEKMAIEILNTVGISDAEKALKKYPHELSGGMRQRVMIAMALITKPAILIADEPTTALDVTIQAQILKLMKELQKKMDMSIILITHDLGVVADIADEIIVMYAGKIVEKGDCYEIFNHPKHPYTKALLKSVPHIENTRKHRLETIEGNIPDMTNPPKGCAFWNRCPHAMCVCTKAEPEVSIQKEGHEVYCWLMDERAKGQEQ